ncbi:hypothetical protein [Aminobacter ciceronei]|uniref:Antitoxin Xre/MbcA/ParS-like toxin-binding domain-containing protein n=1 Tax=Aminobacter ciceronei TaxID=150723 RepID=A0ABR6CF96_9HYPH|nr:hypothetical protein [Aminobacter ciceronei]MBA8909936.1 hypothetical protein [Aminobacter ciceronei]MBA9023708.1 hypothetical protein [Aminobacter ciceronei]
MSIETEHVSENSKREFARFISDEIDRALVHLGNVFGPNELSSAGSLDWREAASISVLPPINDLSPSTTQNHLADLATKVVHAIATEAVRRFTLNEGQLVGATLKAPDSSVSASRNARGPSGELDSMLMEDWAGQVVGQTYLEEYLRIPRSTLHSWKRLNEVIALRTGRRKHVFPLAQFIDGRPVSGIRDVLSIISDPRVSWYWLSRPSSDLDGCVPIDMLRRDRVAEVIAAARAFSQEGRTTSP